MVHNVAFIVFASASMTSVTFVNTVDVTNFFPINHSPSPSILLKTLAMLDFNQRMIRLKNSHNLENDLDSNKKE